MRKLLLFCGILGLAIAIAGCGSSNSTPAVQASAVSVHISDPTTCSATHGGSFSSVFLTFSDVLVHTNPSAGPNDGGWVDLTPNLKNAPVQVDLLALTDATCFLATLGDKTQIQPGTFQQIRLMLASNSQASSIVGGNQCKGAAASAVNCVKFSNGSWEALTIPSGMQTGIKIPSGQLAGGQFTVPAGQTVDLDIDFNTCASIVLAGNQALFKPVLHAGEVSLQSNSINGTVVDNSTGLPIAAAGKVIVMLAQPNAALACSGAGCVSNAAVEDVKMSTLADAAGNFVFCPVSPGTYDVIAIAVNGSTAYAATVTSGVQAGNTLTGNNTMKLKSAGIQATIDGTVNTTSATNTAIAEQGITVEPLQPFMVASTNLLLPIPMFGGNSTLTTVNTVIPTPPNTCSSNTVACGNYSLLVPAGNPNVGVFNATSGTNFAQASGAVNYIVDGHTSSCGPSEEQTNTLAPPGGSLVVTSGGTVTASTLAFSSCQQ